MSLFCDIARWRKLNWSSCFNESKAWTLHLTQMLMELLYLTSTENALTRTMREPIAWRSGPMVTTSNFRCYCVTEKSWKNIINESFQHLYPVAAWMNELPWKARVTASTWYHEVDIATLFFALKAASEEHNVIRIFYGDMSIWIYACPCTGSKI